MIIRAIIRLQQCSSVPGKRYFLHRKTPNHGVAAGPISYHLVEGDSWVEIRKILKAHGVAAHSSVNPESVQGFFRDVGTAQPALRVLDLGWEHAREFLFAASLTPVTHVRIPTVPAATTGVSAQYWGN